MLARPARRLGRDTAVPSLLLCADALVLCWASGDKLVKQTVEKREYVQKQLEMGILVNWLCHPEKDQADVVAEEGDAAGQSSPRASRCAVVALQ